MRRAGRSRCLYVLLVMGLAMANPWHGHAAGIGESTSDRSRLAFVIGNGGYDEAATRWGALPESINDAIDITERLRSFGFEVHLWTDVTRDEMLEIRDFIRERLKEQPETDVLFYYSGHGMGVRRDDYLIPLGVKAGKPESLQGRAIELNYFLTEMKEAKGVQIAIVDACRNNPYIMGGGSTFNRTSTPEGSLVAFATREGYTARARGDKGRNSMYTEKLLVEMDKDPTRALSKILQKTRRKVFKATDEEQLPLELNSLFDDYYLVAPSPEMASVEPGDTRVSFKDQEEWVVRLNAMVEDFSRTMTLSASIDPGMMIANWQQFLDIYASDNPVSTKDNTLREQAREQIKMLSAPPSSTEQPAKQDVASAVFAKGSAFYQSEDYDKAAPLLQQAAQAGNAGAQNTLGFMYDQGMGVAEDDAEAVRWYRKAAEQGHADAQFNLAVMYENGEGVPQDIAEAIRLYRMAAEQGHVKALARLGGGIPQPTDNQIGEEQTLVSQSMTKNSGDNGGSNTGSGGSEPETLYINGIFHGSSKGINDCIAKKSRQKLLKKGSGRVIDMFNASVRDNLYKIRKICGAQYSLFVLGCFVAGVTQHKAVDGVIGKMTLRAQHSYNANNQGEKIILEQDLDTSFQLLYPDKFYRLTPCAGGNAESSSATDEATKVEDAWIAFLYAYTHYNECIIKHDSFCDGKENAFSVMKGHEKLIKQLESVQSDFQRRIPDDFIEKLGPSLVSSLSAPDKEGVWWYFFGSYSFGRLCLSSSMAHSRFCAIAMRSRSENIAGQDKWVTRLDQLKSSMVHETSSSILHSLPASEQLLSNVLEVEVLSHPEGLNDKFPQKHFLVAVKRELSGVRISLPKVRVEATFVEPRNERSAIRGADIRGYILVSLPTIMSCIRRFDNITTYSAMSTQFGMMKAINVHARDIAKWLTRATRGGTLKCPDGTY